MNHSIRNISSAGIIFSLLIFSSCLKNTQEEIDQADRLMTAIDSAEMKFISFDTTRVSSLLDSTGFKVKLLKKFSPNSLDKSTTILLTDYLHVYMALEKYPTDRKNIFPQIAFSRKQLDNMKQDLTSGAMSKEEFAKNFPEEEKAVVELNSYISMTSSKANLLILQYDFMKERVDSFIATLDTLHENEKKNPNLNQMNFKED
ncbi:MAG TPA: hypothetical protein VI757_05085 [Bacteroidia bacterium]|nr:hypothetical protein [Bacteroidia bacterium]